MTRRIEIRTGATSYRDQLDRVRRFRDRVLARESQPYVSDYQDDVSSFFLRCWHLKAWVRRDPLIPQEAKERIRVAVHTSTTLAIANDMATATKHRKIRKPKADAYYSFTRMNVSGESSRLETVITVDGIHMTASAIAKACVEGVGEDPCRRGAAHRVDGDVTGPFI